MTAGREVAVLVAARAVRSRGDSERVSRTHVIPSNSGVAPYAFGALKPVFGTRCGTCVKGSSHRVSVSRARPGKRKASLVEAL